MIIRQIKEEKKKYRKTINLISIVQVSLQNFKSNGQLNSI